MTEFESLRRQLENRITSSPEIEPQKTRQPEFGFGGLVAIYEMGSSLFWRIAAQAAPAVSLSEIILVRNPRINDRTGPQHRGRQK
jgi:hypothetical protein